MRFLCAHTLGGTLCGIFFFFFSAGGLGCGGAFHEECDHLSWSTTKNQSVIRLDLHRGTVSVLHNNVFHKFNNRLASVISGVIDFCNKHSYWFKVF